MIQFYCQKCGAELAKNNNFYTCDKCKNKWPIKKGIGLFSESKYWGEVNQDEMNQILDVVETKGMEEALKLAESKYEVVCRFSRDPSRADWRFYLPVKQDWRILDAGCGLGGMTYPLAKIAKEVIGFDASYERAKFVSEKAKFEGLNNVKTLVGNFDNLPLKNNSFDLVILNGVLEWAGIPNEPKNPREVQKDMLKKCLSLLKPGGYIYIGIENRFALNYLTTGIDHSGVRFTSWMPRFLANIYTKIRLKKPYRSYTYGKRGYEKRFKESGFKKERFTLPASGYNFPKYIIPYDNIYCLQYAIKNLISPSTWKKRWVKKFSNSIIFLKMYRKLFFAFGMIYKK